MDHVQLVNIGASIASLSFIQGGEKRKRDDLSNSQSREFKCVQPYDKKTATNRDRIKSCKDGDVIAERGYGNVPKTRQECVNNCHIDSEYFEDDFGVFPYDMMKQIFENIEDDKLGDMMDAGVRYREIGKEYLPAACDRYLQNEEEIADICENPKNSTQSKCKENGMCDRVLYKMDQLTIEEGMIFRIKDGIELIPEFPNFGWSRMKGIIIPNSVTKIGKKAFFSCTRLKSVIIPASVTEIGDLAFFECLSLTSISIPNSVTRIAEYTFLLCSGLTKITIPDSVTEIGKGAFKSCTKLPLITIPNSVTKIGKIAFASCNNLTTVNIPPSVTEIGEEAFEGCNNLSEIILSDGVKSLGKGAFGGCWSLASINIPDNVTEIGEMAFFSCFDLEDVTLPRHFRHKPDMVREAFHSHVIDRIKYR